MRTQLPIADRSGPSLHESNGARQGGRIAPVLPDLTETKTTTRSVGGFHGFRIGPCYWSTAPFE